MPISPRNLRIGGAVLIAVLMVAGGYILPGYKFPKTKTVNAELTDDLLTSYVSKDTDSDGLPDWQEALYGTDVNKADTDGDGITDGEAVRKGLLTPTALASQVPTDPIGVDEVPGEAPTKGSITEQFSRAFFQAYMEASGGQPMDADAQQALIQRLLADFSARATKAIGSSYSQVSIHPSAGTSVRDYAASVESTIRRNDIDMEGKKPSSLMQAVIENGDESARKKLSALANAEAAMARELLTLPVPPALANDHLLMVRSFDSLAKATQLVTTYEKDPVGVMGALAAYAPTSRDFGAAFKGLATAVLFEGEPVPGTPGAYIVEIARSAETP